VLAYTNERALTVPPVKHIPSWIPGSPQGYGKPLEKRLRAVFEEPFDYVQSKMVGFPSHFEGVHQMLPLGFWTKPSILYVGGAPEAPRGENEYIGTGR
jgi:hypothetical protein